MPYVIVGCLAVQAHLTATSALPPVLANGIGRRSGESPRGAPLVCPLIRKNIGHAAGSMPRVHSLLPAAVQHCLQAMQLPSPPRGVGIATRGIMIGRLSFVAFLMGKVFIMTLVLVRSCLRCGESRRERDSHGLPCVTRGLCAARADVRESSLEGENGAAMTISEAAQDAMSLFRHTQARRNRSTWGFARTDSLLSAERKTAGTHHAAAGSQQVDSGASS